MYKIAFTERRLKYEQASFRAEVDISTHKTRRNIGRLTGFRETHLSLTHALKHKTGCTETLDMVLHIAYRKLANRFARKDCTLRAPTKAPTKIFGIPAALDSIGPTGCTWLSHPSRTSTRTLSAPRRSQGITRMGSDAMSCITQGSCVYEQHRVS